MQFVYFRSESVYYKAYNVHFNNIVKNTTNCKEKGYQFRLVNTKPLSGQTYLRLVGKSLKFKQVMIHHTFTTIYTYSSCTLNL